MVVGPLNTQDKSLLPFLTVWSLVRVASQSVSKVSPRRLGCAGLLCAALSGLPAFAVTHTGKVHHTRHSPLRAVLPGHYQVGFSSWNSMFPGSHEMLVRQNEELDRLQLPRIVDDYELMRYELSQELVPVNESDALKIAPDLP